MLAGGAYKPGGRFCAYGIPGEGGPDLYPPACCCISHAREGGEGRCALAGDCVCECGSIIPPAIDPRGDAVADRPSCVYISSVRGGVHVCASTHCTLSEPFEVESFRPRRAPVALAGRAHTSRLVTNAHAAQRRRGIARFST
jgi:hypothetical protein